MEVRDYPAGGVAFDYGMIACLTLLVAGGYTDGWAHNNLQNIETFFTPWHAMLYGGFAVSAAYLAAQWLRFRIAGYGWLHALPRGYLWSLVGAIVFTAGGALDMLWHIVFGIEADVAALVSPTHLTLFAGAMLMYLGPLRAALARNDAAAGAAALPKLLSLLYAWTAITFFTQYASPYGDTFGAAAFTHQGPREIYFVQALGMAALLLQTAVMMGVVLFAAARFRLPAGSFALILTVQAVMMTVMRQGDIYSGILPVILAALVAGIACDVLYAWLRPAPDRKGAWLAFGAAVPFLVYALYFAAVTAFGGTWWPPHMLYGSPVEAAFAGYGIAWLMVTPGAALLRIDR